MSELADPERAWRNLQRGLEFDGEQRANRLRIWAVALFYTVELISYYGLSFGAWTIIPKEHQDAQFHARVTMLVVTWVMLAACLTLAARGRIFGWWMKYLTTTIDLVLLTGLLVIAAGPRSALVVGYFVLVALSALRFHLGTVRCATMGAIGSYWLLCGYFAYATNRVGAVPFYQVLLTSVAMAMEGVILGQMIRKVRLTAMRYADRIDSGESA